MCCGGDLLSCVHSLYKSEAAWGVSLEETTTTTEDEEEEEEEEVVCARL